MPARRKRTSANIGVGLTTKQMKRKKPIGSELLNKIEPITDNQKVLFDEYDKGQKHCCLWMCRNR